MKITIFEVEGWEREVFLDLEGEHEVVCRDDDTTHRNIAAFERGEAENIVGLEG
jgi:hypothetical protein